MITGAARTAGVTGWPVAHSLSPRLHGFWLARHGIDGLYAPFPVHPDRFAEAMTGLRAAGVRGVNVTVPHKQAALTFADTVDEAAGLIGAVNTLIFHADGSTEGRNTDAPGFMRNLIQHDVDPAAGPALLFGAGGAARAAVFALLAAGTPEVWLVNRHVARARQLAADLADPRVRVLEATPDAARLTEVGLVVNTTSVGMKGRGRIDLNVSALPATAVVHDIVYTPLRTGLLADAQACGLKTVDGLGMLLHQAAPAFEAFFGQAPGVDDALRDHLLEVL
ncbi:shikimate dehydrogenase [Minwuia sp.]|uniref:shikimate dehydrogenase n=1 Tax=Minwuia sp. TaxID=2493630 RepID=UPI003A92BDFB